MGLFLAVVAALVCGPPVLAATGPAPAAPEESAQTWLQAAPDSLQWFREAHFGMFVCWGPVSLKGTEIGWSRRGHRPGTSEPPKEGIPVEVYDNLYRTWKPDRFDARQWVQLARDAGMKYMIFLVKHHDGFCLYDTRLTDYKSTAPAAAWQHDVLRDITDACHAAGLKLFVYYSQPDWHHPDYRTENHGRYIQYLHGQVREILTNYGRIDGLWFDGLGGKAQDWDAETLFKLARGLQPHLLINNRCGLPGDFDTPEQKIGTFQTDRAWESCITLGTQWSWKPDDRIKSLKQCIDTLVRCAGGDGNLALNTGPMPDGQIEPRQAERFREIGRWMATCGESIYRTRGGPFPPTQWGASTHRGNRIYVHVLSWDHGPIEVPRPGRRIVKASLLGGGRVEMIDTPTAIELRVPPESRQELDTVVILEIEP